jgi:hypothetical protein
MAIILKANKVNLFVSSVFFVYWYHSPNFLDTPRKSRFLYPQPEETPSRDSGQFNAQAHANFNLLPWITSNGQHLISAHAQNSADA